MRNDLAITVEHLSKMYKLRGQERRYRTMRDSIMEKVAAPFRSPSASRITEQRQRPSKDFLALDDISFTVSRGETIGVMGHNGAGKSTLLKILSRITEPTRGSATLFGRVGSLLEVGTGFHLELSGRDNIYLSGAIIGMKKAEIGSKFDEIVSFAEVEDFIDVPVKHYSSGMHLRLAFAVAAHLQPAILLIDEVLAVGDANFQKKCLGKMDDVAASGRTVLFVSHNLSAIKELCRTGIVLSRGQLLMQGPVIDAISSYTESIEEATVTNEAAGWQRLKFIATTSGEEWVVRGAEATSYNAQLILADEFTRGRVILLVHDSTGALVVHQRLELEHGISSANLAGAFDITVKVPVLWLGPGLYTVHLKFLGHSSHGLDVKYVSERRILDVRGWTQDRANALLAPACEWSAIPIDSTLSGNVFRYAE